ncbi:MAG: hypothetical protein MK193_04110 [Lentisphaeria bacterium]|nr:hypothetical protein [Lentisphaeria bacterium]
MVKYGITLCSVFVLVGCGVSENTSNETGVTESVVEENVTEIKHEDVSLTKEELTGYWFEKLEEGGDQLDYFTEFRADGSYYIKSIDIFNEDKAYNLLEVDRKGPWKVDGNKLYYEAHDDEYLTLIKKTDTTLTFLLEDGATTMSLTKTNKDYKVMSPPEGYTGSKN